MLRINLFRISTKWSKLVALIILLYSCTSNEEIIEKKLTKCVNEATNFSEYNKTGKGDFYSMIAEIETTIFLYNKLQGFTKGDYEKKVEELLINKEQSGETLYKNVSDVFDKYGYIPRVNNFKVFNQCPFFVLITESNEMTSSLFFQSQALNELEASGYEDVGLIKELISSTKDEDFKKIIYRTPIILSLINGLDNIYGEGYTKEDTFDFSK